MRLEPEITRKLAGSLTAEHMELIPLWKTYGHVPRS